MYELRYSTQLLDPDEEIEPNDSASRATALSDGTSSSGTKRGYLPAGDRDFWLVDKLDKPMLLSVKIEPPAEIDVSMKVRSVRGKLMGEANSKKRGGAESFHNVPIPAKTPVVIEVSGSSSHKSTEAYTLTWSLAPAAAPSAPADDE